MADVYQMTTLNLFEDLKHTNIKNEDFKQILASYQKLASNYIKDNQADLYKDLNKQKKVIFSYLDTLKNESIKKVANLHKKLEAEMGNIDEIDTFQTPEKQVQFIKVAYNNGKWTISAHNFEDTEFSKKETPEAINCLVSLCERLDEQEAAYALCHAKKAGLFTMAALPYVRTEEFTNTALEPRYMKDPGTVLGPIDHSWESSVDNTNMPVSRQIASIEDDIQEMDTFKDEDGDMITISSISGDAIITFDNDIYTKEEVEENIKSGYWTKVEAASEDIKVQRLKKQAAPLASTLKQKAVINEAMQRVASEVIHKMEEAKKAELEKAEEIEATMEPRLRKIAAKIDSITFKEGEAAPKFQRMSEELDSGMTLNYSRPVENYQKRTVPVAKAEEIIEKMRAYLSPKNLKAFNELAEQLFVLNSKLESFSVSLTDKDPINEELIQEEMEKLRKIIKTSQNEAFMKDAAYDELDKMLIAGQINFDQYNILSDFAEMDSKMLLDSVKHIQANFVDVQAGTMSNITEKIKEAFNTAKEWIMDKLSFLSLQEKEISDISEELDQVIPEGE